ncbi:MAG: protein tyrosine phosphatase [Burkholderiales bacterium PBB3]|nr:MAG: protein tyrosine phosphatase [Burkholderiales bacterium PBB3]
MYPFATNVLFVSRENAGRSLLAEACLRHLGRGKFKAYSCGVPGLIANSPSHWSLLALQTAGMPSSDLHCKSWSEFTKSGAPRMDFVISLDAETLYDHPMWPGQPETALWSYPPLVTVNPGYAEFGLAAVHTLVSLRRRIELLISLHSKSRVHSDLRHDLRDLAHL